MESSVRTLDNIYLKFPSSERAIYWMFGAERRKENLNMVCNIFFSMLMFM